MKAQNDNLRTALSPDGCAMIVVDSLDRCQIEDILLYIFGMVDAVQTVTNHMVVSLAAAGLSTEQLATLTRWRDTMDEISQFSSVKLQKLASGSRPAGGRMRKATIEHSPDLMAFFAEAAGVLSLGEAYDGCVAKFGKEHTPSKASINRFWLRVSKARKRPFN